MKKTAIASALFFALPLVALAQYGGGPQLTPVREFVKSVASIIAMIIPILIALAMVVFFYGLVRYVWGKGTEPDHALGKKIMIAGLVSLFVMVCVWGIVRLAADSLGIQQGGSAPVPGIPGYSGSANNYLTQQQIGDGSLGGGSYGYYR